jgi:peptidyl-prolyl cis-trans isomerase B (cyclophilin B)
MARRPQLDLNAPWPVLLGTLRALEPPTADIAGSLKEWSETALDEATGALRIRLIQLRCVSAALIAGRSSLHPLLVSCDPDADGVYGPLAVLEVLDRGPLEGDRRSGFLEILSSKHPAVRQAALKLLGGHREIEDSPGLLAQALGDPHAGTVAVAASLLEAHPDRAQRGAKSSEIDPSVVQVLTEAFERRFGPDQVAVQGALMGAASALGVLSLKSRIEPYCQNQNATLRLRAERALRLMGSAVSCSDTETHRPAEAPAPVSSVQRVAFKSELGRHELQLHPGLAPSNVARVIELVEDGFYDALIVHRAVPGKVVQFGDPNADGYGGAPKGTVPTEGSSQTFGPFAIGMAQGGPDTGSSQLFISLSPAPDLDGDFTWLGTADESWANLVFGDVLTQASVVRKTP